MRALIWLLVLAGLAVGVSLAAQYNDGYALLVLPPWRLELSLNLLLILVVAGFIAFYITVRLIVTLLRLPARVGEFRVSRARIRGESALRDAVRLLIEGRYGRALRRAQDAYKAGHAPDLASLLALRAATQLRDPKREQEWRQNALEHDAQNHYARLTLEALLAVENHDYETAKRVLGQLEAESGRHIAALRLLLKVQQKLGNWREVVRLVRRLVKHRAITAAQGVPLIARAHREIIKSLDDDGPALKQYVEQMPASERSAHPFAVEAARALIRAGHWESATRLIEDAIDENWESQLAAAYGDCEGGDVMGRIARAESWLLAHPRDVELLRALGRLCRRISLWGKAQSYLEASLAIQPSRAAHLELASLLDEIGRGEESNRHYRAAALL